MMTYIALAVSVYAVAGIVVIALSEYRTSAK
jgi:hypothetical protein